MRPTLLRRGLHLAVALSTLLSVTPSILHATETRSFDPQGLDRVLDSSPRNDFDLDGAVVLELPSPGAGTTRFRVVERPVLSPSLQAARPDLRTYVGVQVGEPGVGIRITRSAQGLIAMVLGPAAWVLDSTRTDRSSHVQLSTLEEAIFSPSSRCEVDDSYGKPPEPSMSTKTAGSLGEELRIYDLALTGTGEFTQFHGSVANAEAQLTSLVNLANAYWERDLSVRMQIVDLNVYDDPATDPFSTGTVMDGTALDENHNALVAKLGSSGFDIGHVLSRLGGGGWSGLAQVASVCDRFGKGRGGTFAAQPSAFVLLEGILHEAGHQLGASHSFNGSTDACGPNRSPAWAYEIASGISIMSYAGTCGVEDVTRPRVLMYNGGSIEAIHNTLTSQPSCGQSQSTGNLPPVAEAGPDYTIPRETAFVLDGSASSDPDLDSLTFSWEQHDLGPPSPPYGPLEGPLMRNFQQIASPLRSVPSYPGYRNGLFDVFEQLPTVDRLLSFRLIVRDNDPGHGGVAWDTVFLTVAGEPFRILSPNGGESIEGGTPTVLSWQVGGGSVASEVRILYSSDRGDTWTEMIAATPNDGSEEISWPCEVTSQARIRIEALGNIFFDISDGDFSILPDETAPQVVCPAPFEVAATSPEGIDKEDPALADWIASAVATDNCDPDPSVVLASGQVIPVGVNQLTFVAQDDAGHFAFCQAQLTVTEGTPAPELPARTALLGVHPNPFNPRTTIRFHLRREQQVRLEILDPRGRRVELLHQGTMSPGIHEWTWTAQARASGVYFARLVTEEGTFHRRMALLK